MKSLLVPLLPLITLGAASAQEPASAPSALANGDEVPSLDGLDYIQGEPLAAGLDEDGKVYLLDCWATWCGPCVASMPHLAELHETHGENGLEVVAVNVFEDNPEAVRAFVAENEAMRFPVALSGPADSTFATSWLEPRGVESIPTTFVVRDGRLVDTMHPMEIDDELIETLLAEDFDLDAFAAEQAQREQESEALQAEIQQAVSEEDWQAILDLEDRLRELDESLADQLILTAQINLGDYESVTALLDEMPADDPLEIDQLDVLSMVAGMAPSSEALDEFAAEQVSTYQALVEGEDLDSRGLVVYHVGLMRFQALAGEDEAAQSTLETLEAELTRATEAGELPAAMAESIQDNFREALEGDDFPATETLFR